MCIRDSFYYSKYFIDYGAAPRIPPPSVGRSFDDLPLPEDPRAQKFDYVKPVEIPGVDVQKDPGSRFAA